MSPVIVIFTEVSPMRAISCVVALILGTSSLAAQQVIFAADDRSEKNPAVASVSPSTHSAEPETHGKNLVVVTTVTVTSTSGAGGAGATSYRASARDILSSAGTYGDFSRYLQLFPGVTFNSDESDDVLVRGGNPIENLYQIDGIDIPNINHIATQGTTGGLVSMVDTSAIQNVDFLTGGYDASYDERLSSVISIHTRELEAGTRYSQVDAGFVGAGGTLDLPTRSGGSVLLSGHRSLLNLFTNDIGLNGVPIYTNALVRVSPAVSPIDSIMFLAVGGFDSINIKPEALDADETNTINTQYSGWRGTAGFLWHHLFSANAFGILTISDSEDQQNIQQQDQIYNDWLPTNVDPTTIPAVPVYSERTHDGIRAFKYDWHFVHGPMELSTGASLRFHDVAYDVAQPNGEQSPLSADPTRSDATTSAPHLTVGEDSQYLQLSYRFTYRWTMGAGYRGQVFDFGMHKTITPRWNTSYQLSNSLTAHASFGEYAQLPPYIQLTSFPQNYRLLPMRDRQIIAGVDAKVGGAVKLKLEAYRKDYHDYPVSSEYPTLSLANEVDTLGQEFIWLPLVSAGGGRASGVELSAETRLMHSRLYITGNVALSRDKYSGLDGVLRPGNFDYPLVVNAAGVYRTKKHYEVSYRYEYSSGRPYTPFDLQDSYLQDRPIYDLSQLNALRGPFYSRLDFSVSRTFFFKDRPLTVYGGLENATNRQNFLGYAWLQRADIYYSCNGGNLPSCVQEETQMSRFPNFGARYSF